jgi:hypothetical protein
MNLDETTTQIMLSFIQLQGGPYSDVNRQICATLLKNKIKQVYGVRARMLLKTDYSNTHFPTTASPGPRPVRVKKMTAHTFSPRGRWPFFSRTCPR